MKEFEADIKAVVDRIRIERSRQNLSQIQVATKAGVAQSFYSAIESNQKVPTLTTLFKIAKALEIPVRNLFEDFEPNREAAKEDIIKQIRDRL